MTTAEKTLDIVKAQSELLIHITERLVRLQAAFSVFAQQQIESQGANLDAHNDLRAKMFTADFSGETTRLSESLKDALHSIETAESID